MAEENEAGNATEPVNPKPVPKLSRANTVFLNLFAVYVFTCAFGYIFAITFFAVPKLNVRFADTSLGFILGTVVTAVIVWAFRSSKAQIDKEKEELKVKQMNGIGG